MVTRRSSTPVRFRPPTHTPRAQHPAPPPLPARLPPPRVNDVSMRWTSPDEATTPTRRSAVLPPSPLWGEGRGAGPPSSPPSPPDARCLIPDASASASLPPHIDQDLLLDQYLDPDIPPRELALSFAISLAQLLAWVRSPETRATIDAINQITHQRTSDLAPAQRARAAHTLASLSTIAPGCRLTPTECRAAETARKAASALLRAFSPPSLPTLVGWASRPSLAPPFSSLPPLVARASRPYSPSPTPSPHSRKPRDLNPAVPHCAPHTHIPARPKTNTGRSVSAPARLQISVSHKPRLMRRLYQRPPPPPPPPP